jgi:predicted RNase H-like nuclease
VISRVFGHREGSAHTANRHQPAFSKGVRAESLAKTLDLSTDPVLPSAAPVRRMIEVYPHTAILCLFRLPRTLKYKAKKGRTVASRKLAFRELIGHLQSVSGPLFQLASTHWQNLCSEIEQCRTSTTLDHAEDELDAYVCAYVALYYWTHRTARCGIIGDPEQGYIVTPIDDDARVRLRGLVSGG